MNKIIAEFLQEQTVATICCKDAEGLLYCFSCFYEFDEEYMFLYFKSSPAAHHSSLLAVNPLIAGTILPDKLNKLMTKGIQFQGEFLNSVSAKDAYMRYHKKYPMALAKGGEVYLIKINSIKMTDSTLGFGKKLHWKREEMQD